MPELLQYILSIMGLVAAISYGYGQFKKGKNESKLDTISILEKDVSILKDKIVKLTNQINELKSIIDDKDKKLSDALSILQGRDPQMQEFIKQMSEYIHIGRPLMESVVKDVLPTVAKLDKFLNKQTF